MLSIVVGDLYRRGAPREERAPITRAETTGGGSATIEMTPLWDRVDCRYFKPFQGKTEDAVEYFLWVTWTRPNYGGERAWLQCARLDCGRRCGRLFLKAPYLVCRACAGVGYPSQLKPTHVRRVERAQAIRAELVASPASSLPGRGVLPSVAKSSPTCSARMEVGDGCQGSRQARPGER